MLLLSIWWVGVWLAPSVELRLLNNAIQALKDQPQELQERDDPREQLEPNPPPEASTSNPQNESESQTAQAQPARERVQNETVTREKTITTEFGKETPVLQKKAPPPKPADPDAWKTGDATPSDSKPMEERHVVKGDIERGAATVAPTAAAHAAKPISSGILKTAPSTKTDKTQALDQPKSEFLPDEGNVESPQVSQAVPSTETQNLSAPAPAGPRNESGETVSTYFISTSTSTIDASTPAQARAQQAIENREKGVSNRLSDLSAALTDSPSPSSGEANTFPITGNAPLAGLSPKGKPKEAPRSPIAKLLRRVASKVGRLVKSRSDLENEFRKPSPVTEILAGFLPSALSEQGGGDQTENVLCWLSAALGFGVALLLILPIVFRRKKTSH